MNFNLSLYTTGSLILLYTCVSTSTYTVSIFILPYLQDFFPSYEVISVICTFISVAKLTSSLLVFFFPNHALLIMVCFAIKAVTVAALSETYHFLPENKRGIVIGFAVILLAFSCGSTVARALSITECQENTKLLSYAYTLGKQSVHIVELICTFAIFGTFGWDGFAVWVILAYFIIAVFSLFLMIRPPVHSPGYDSVGEQTHDDSLLSSLDDGHNVPVKLPSTDMQNRFQAISDLSSVSLCAWLLLFVTEMVSFTIGIISLTGVIYVKEVFHLKASEASFTMILPQVLVIPVFLLSLKIRITPFTLLIYPIFGGSLVVLFPYVKSPGYISILMFFYELFNALRLTGQMPAFYSIVNDCRVAKRFVTVTTLLSFTFRTIGLSTGSSLYKIFPELPFLIAGCVHVISGLSVIGIYLATRKIRISNQLITKYPNIPVKE